MTMSMNYRGVLYNIILAKVFWFDRRRLSFLHIFKFRTRHRAIALYNPLL